MFITNKVYHSSRGSIIHMHRFHTSWYLSALSPKNIKVVKRAQILLRIGVPKELTEKTARLPPRDVLGHRAWMEASVRTSAPVRTARVQMLSRASDASLSMTRAPRTLVKTVPHASTREETKTISASALQVRQPTLIFEIIFDGVLPFYEEQNCL